MKARITCFISFIKFYFFYKIFRNKEKDDIPSAYVLVGLIRFPFSAHGGQLYKRISLESSLNLIIWHPSAIVLYPRETQEYYETVTSPNLDVEPTILLTSF